MNIVFMGTPDFAACILKSIYEAGHNITLVVTQPDKPKGRGKEMAVSAVKAYAQEVGLPVFQPVKIKSEESVAELKKYPADIFVVAAFGQILSKEILEMPKYGCVNAHASLLPKYRGASPIQWSIMMGENETGVTMMQMDEGLDTGDMLTRVVVPITSEDTGETLHDKLAEAGAKLCVDTLVDIENGNLNPVKQPKECDSYAKLLNKQMGELDFNKDASKLELLIRAFTPWPGTYSYLDGKILKIIKAHVSEDSFEDKCGEVVNVSSNEIQIACKTGSLVVEELQLEGKKRMKVHDFLLGYKIMPGTKLGKQ